MPHIDMNSQ